MARGGLVRGPFGVAQSGTRANPPAPPANSRLFRSGSLPNSQWVPENNEEAAGRLVNATSKGDAGNRADHLLGTTLGSQWTNEATLNTPQVANSELVFTQTSGVVVLYTQNFTPSGAFRIACRVRANPIESIGTSIGILVKDNTSSETGNGVLVLMQSNTGTTFGAQVFILNSGTYTQQGTTLVLPDLNVWQYLVLDFDGTNWKGYWSRTRSRRLQIGTTNSTKTLTVAKMSIRSDCLGGAIDFVDVEV